ncbi:unnamed protein product, partial [Amoebophrya sp. A120]|eukprot:GSA120T00008519001.1
MGCRPVAFRWWDRWAPGPGLPPLLVRRQKARERAEGQRKEREGRKAERDAVSRFFFGARGVRNSIEDLTTFGHSSVFLHRKCLLTRRREPSCRRPTLSLVRILERRPGRQAEAGRSARLFLLALAKRTRTRRTREGRGLEFGEPDGEVAPNALEAFEDQNGREWAGRAHRPPSCSKRRKLRDKIPTRASAVPRPARARPCFFPGLAPSAPGPAACAIDLQPIQPSAVAQAGCQPLPVPDYGARTAHAPPARFAGIRKSGRRGRVVGQ